VLHTFLSTQLRLRGEKIVSDMRNERQPPSVWLAHGS
jgi:hypothetical protein